MQHLDVQVVEQALRWVSAGQAIWLCTVVSSYGSAPRAPGAMLVANGQGEWLGSLSGGCVEEAFLQGLQQGEFQAACQVVRYGDGQGSHPTLRLPCGGVLQVLVECRPPSEAWQEHLARLLDCLRGQRRGMRQITLANGDYTLAEDEQDRSERVWLDQETIRIRLGPALRLLLAGVSPVAQACALFARALGCEVIACDPREEMQHGVLPEIEVLPVLPSMFIAAGGCHSATAVVALTHDPRLDDLAMMEAVRTPAFYIGVMGSAKTSAKRAERLERSGGLSAEQLARIHMPIGLRLGSKTPAEIALAVMADILRVYHGKERHAL